jgi:hypothetical protein
MKNITFSADESLITAARTRAAAEQSTLQEAFREWLERYALREATAERAMQTIADLRGSVRTGGRRFSRDERNER